MRALRARVGEEQAASVHRGATSQDIVDSAAMLVARRAATLIDADLRGAADECARLADEHRHTVMAARTLLQQAVPTTFGFKAAGWLVGLVEARTPARGESRRRCPHSSAARRARSRRSATAGSRCCASTPRSSGCASRFCPGTRCRAPIAELAGALAGAAGAAAKIGGDIVLLAQTEVGEVAERESGGSSTMPHKRNPVGAVLAIACERHARANAGDSPGEPSCRSTSAPPAPGRPSGTRSRRRSPRPAVRRLPCGGRSPA